MALAGVKFRAYPTAKQLLRLGPHISLSTYA